MIFALLLAATAAAQTLSYRLLNEDLLQQRLKLADKSNPERFARLKNLFAESGCKGDFLQEQMVKGSKEPNMICGVTGTGENPTKIIIGAHFDATGGAGVIDNWTGAVLLPTLYQFLSQGKPRHTFEFVAFAAEEKGLLGSKAYLKSIAELDRSRIAAVIVMDSLGLTPTKCWAHGSTNELITAAAAVAFTLKLQFTGMNMEKVGTTDSQPFQEAHIPVLCLHSVTPETLRIINGKDDDWARVSWKDYYDSYRLISALLSYLDQTLP
jgi:hypothetical protein